ncbi:MAG: metal-dependent hydrolase [Myxococcales bacterium FL481]|nr:MAG: metal-dependent hydrolase [Myxococcales bacterium FL481]
MDSLTQAALGAAAVMALGPRRLGPGRWMAGALGGLAADLDMLFEAAADPLLGLRFHRHFTHALAFIPLGGLVAALPLLVRATARKHAKWLVVATTVGYATHAPLDALTSYGTVLAWPWSERRFALDWLSIVDPLVTLALIIGVVLSVRRDSVRPARAALLAVLAYVAVGAGQHHRARQAVEELARSRAQVPQRVRVFPLVMSNMRWRGLYEYDGRVYAAAVTAPWWGEATVDAGGSTELFASAQWPAALQDADCVREALTLYTWFADGWLASLPDQPHSIGDVRYSRSPAAFEPMWALRFDARARECVELVPMRPTVGEVWRSLRRE